MCNFIADDKACHHPLHSVARNSFLQEIIQVCSNSNRLSHLRAFLVIEGFMVILEAYEILVTKYIYSLFRIVNFTRTFSQYILLFSGVFYLD